MEPSLIILAGLSTTVLDFTDALSPLLIRLLGLVWVSAGAIVYSAARPYWSERTEHTPLVASTFADHQDAA